MQSLVAPFEKTLGELLFQQQQLGEPIPVPLTLAILRQVCDALDYAHNLRDANGNPMYMLHRDVSPGYILVGQQGGTRLIASMAIQANPSYVAPEILLGMQPDPRADLFSLGVVAHEMLTGRPLFLGSNEHDTLARVCQLAIPPPSTINPAVTHDIEGIVLMALARDPTYRWQSAAMMRDGLASVAARNGLEGIPEGAWAALFHGQRMAMPPAPYYAPPELPAQPQAVPIVEAPIAAQPTVVAPPPPIAAQPTVVAPSPAPLSAVPTVIAPSPSPVAPVAAKPALPAIPLVAIPAAPTAIPALPRPKSTTKMSNVASAKTPAPVITQPLPSPPQRPTNPAAKTPAPVLRPTLPSPSENMFDDAPATMASMPAFDSRPPVDEPGPATFDDSMGALVPNAFDDAPATMASARPLNAPPANAFDDAPATMASLPAMFDERAKSPVAFHNAFEDSPATIANARPVFEQRELPAKRPPLAPPPPSAVEDVPTTTPRPKLPSQPLPSIRKPDDLPAPRAKHPSQQQLPTIRNQPTTDDLPAPRAKHPSQQQLPTIRNQPTTDDLPAPRKQPSSQGLPTFKPAPEDLPAPRAKKPSQQQLPSTRHPDDPAGPRASRPPSQEVPHSRKEAGVDDLPAPRATRSAKAAALFEDLPSPKPKATDEASAPMANPNSPLFDDLPAPRPNADPGNALFADLPAPRASKPAPSPRALSNFDDDDAPAPVHRKQPRASTADIDGFLASVANEQAPAQTGDPEIDAYVASVVNSAAPATPPYESPPYEPPPYEQPAEPPAEPALYAQLPPPRAFELELGEFTNIGAAPLISFGNTGETPMAVGVGPKPPQRTAAPSLPPPVAMISANRVTDPEDDESSSKKKLLLILLGALLVIGGAVIAFVLLSD